MAPSGLRRRNVVLAVVVATTIFIVFITTFSNASKGLGRTNPFKEHKAESSIELHPDTLTGKAIAPKLGNETAKAELGRAAWKLFHTTFARFPDNPTEDESFALKSYIHLFQRLYPCGECAEHFRTILDKYPPQVSSRSIAAGWGCHVHNEVNKSLGKQIFDCSKIGDFYDCGCSDDEEETGSRVQSSDDRSGRTNEEDRNDYDDEIRPLKLEKEDYQRGG